MSKTIYDGESPKSQSIESVKSLLAFVGRASDPLPTDVSLDGGRVVLVLSGKRDCYYTVTARGCSCPSSTYRPGQSCKHQRKHFAARDEPLPESRGSLIDTAGFRPVAEVA